MANENILNMEKTSEINDDVKVSLWEKVAYGGGDTACNISLGVINSLITLFYTDYAGISVGIVGMVMLISRVFDGFSDVAMGFITEKVNSKWGKARPWVLWTSVPYFISTVALFFVPADASETFQFIYIFVTYNLVTTVIYTALNLPYSVLGSLMTRNQHERALIAMFRMGMSPFGKILAVTFTMPLIKYFGNDQAAWIKVISMWSGVAFILLIICFVFCKERVKIAAKKEEKVDLKKGIKALFQNKYWIFCLALWALINVHNAVVGMTLPYYCKYILLNDGWVYSVLYTTEFLIFGLGSFGCSLLLKKITKRDMAMYGSILAVIGQALIFLNPSDFNLVWASVIIRSIGVAPMFAVIFGMLADTVEYGQWKTHTRYEGLIFSSASLGSKVGPGLMSALIGALLSFAGYISTTSGVAVQQPESAKNMIMMLYQWGPIGVWVTIGIILYFYKLDNIYDDIMIELKERESRGIL
jgi:GPH family glycoside/pentoside/hexuronide:cation symporter